MGFVYDFDSIIFLLTFHIVSFSLFSSLSLSPSIFHFFHFLCFFHVSFSLGRACHRRRDGRGNPEKREARRRSGRRLARRLRRFLLARLAGRTARLRVLDEAGEPVRGAEVAVVSMGRSRTNSRGYARLYLPRNDNYALVVRAEGREEVLYEELLAPGGTYVYRPDAEQPEGRIFVLSRE